jgi:hypothetical protein
MACSLIGECLPGRRFPEIALPNVDLQSDEWTGLMFILVWLASILLMAYFCLFGEAKTCKTRKPNLFLLFMA